MYFTQATNDLEDPFVELNKEKCMACFGLLHSHLKVLSNKESAGTRTDNGFKWAFSLLFGEDNEKFTKTMFLNVDQLEKQLEKEELHENGSTVTFRVLKEQFQQFFDSWLSSDFDSVMTCKYFSECIRIEVKTFKEMLTQ